MIAFLCATPYQVFNAVNIRRTLFPKEPADLYLLTYTSDLSGLESPLKASQLFQNVYLVRTFDGPTSSLKLARQLCFLQKDLARILYSKVYRVLFGTCVGSINTVFYSQLRRNNPDLEFDYYDEGIGVYSIPIFQESEKLRRFVRGIGGRDYYHSIRHLYVYQPQAMVENRQFPLRRIPPVPQTDAPVYNSIFGYEGEGAFYKSRTVLYLDQAFEKQLGLAMPNGELLSQLTAYFPKERMAVRLHPTRPQEDPIYGSSGICCAPRSSLPWEVLLLNLDLSQRVFVSVHSTACLTPKLVFDQEPTVILLYKLVEPLFEKLPPVLRPNEAFFQRVKGLYRDPQKFLIPTSFQELKGYLSEKWMGEKG